eukprot:TRINITY_DN28837_c0_g1_i1.p1 TRINITY_DN28837_c0_g1~~TRINITY_DN28837_c0_g1_i1.p1  ORF type:complete len:290 (+),score=59.17 TRINITY_DN28837_c0_g1_i1:77-946(+)
MDRVAEVWRGTMSQRAAVGRERAASVSPRRRPSVAPLPICLPRSPRRSPNRSPRYSPRRSPGRSPRAAQHLTCEALPLSVSLRNAAKRVAQDDLLAAAEAVAAVMDDAQEMMPVSKARSVSPSPGHVCRATASSTRRCAAVKEDQKRRSRISSSSPFRCGAPGPRLITPLAGRSALSPSSVPAKEDRKRPKPAGRRRRAPMSTASRQSPPDPDPEPKPVASPVVPSPRPRGALQQLEITFADVAADAASVGELAESANTRTATGSGTGTTALSFTSGQRPLARVYSSMA